MLGRRPCYHDSMKLMQELSAPTRIRIKEGDIFAYKIGDGFRFIRIINERCLLFSTSRVLCYFYSPVSKTPMSYPHLAKSDLLIPPVLIHRAAFKDGFTLRVAQGVVETDDRYAQHCFMHFHEEQCVNEYGEHVEYSEPARVKGAHDSLNTLEEELAEALDLIPHTLTQAERAGYVWRLPALPRPLLRASKAGKLPGSWCVLRIAENQEKVIALAAKLRDAKPRPGVDIEETNTTAMHYLRRMFSKLSDLGEITSSSFTEWDGQTYSFSYLVKSRQHERFFAAIESALGQLGLKRYWIVEGEFGDWLNGTVSNEEVQRQRWYWPQY